MKLSFILLLSIAFVAAQEDATARNQVATGELTDVDQSTPMSSGDVDEKSTDQIDDQSTGAPQPITEKSDDKDTTKGNEDESSSESSESSDHQNRLVKNLMRRQPPIHRKLVAKIHVHPHQPNKKLNQQLLSLKMNQPPLNQKPQRPKRQTVRREVISVSRTKTAVVY